jgi:hypothetical protein
MARAVEQHKTKPEKRTSRRRTSRQSGPPNCQAIDDVFFRRWRDLFGSERALQHLEDTLRSKPSWHVSASGKVTRADHPGFWERVTLHVEITAEGVDCLAVHHDPYVHEPDYRTLFGVKPGRFFLRTSDVIECEERLGGGNNVPSDYDPIEEFEREIEGRPRTPQRLFSPTAAPLPAPTKEPTPLAAKAKSRKPKQPRMYKRFTKDDALVVEAIEGLNSKKYPNVWQAAQALAPRAEGSATAQAKAFRLNGKIGEAYKNLKTPQNISKQIK